MWWKEAAQCAHGVVVCVREVSTGCSTHGWAYTVEVSIDVALVWCWLYCIGCRICPCVRISMTAISVTLRVMADLRTSAGSGPYEFNPISHNDDDHNTLLGHATLRRYHAVPLLTACFSFAHHHHHD